MTLSKFSFYNEIEKWKLNEVTFSDFNLLVGKSGVGKTKIINAIKQACQSLVFEAEKAMGCQWKMELQVEDRVCIWEAEVARSYSQRSDYFVKERLVIDTEEIINVDQKNKIFFFKENKLPRLDNKRSAISLLQYEPSIAPIYSVLSGFLFSEASEHKSRFWLREENAESLGTLITDYSSFGDLCNSTDLPILVKVWICQRRFPEEFKRINEQFSEIFPTVSTVRVVSFNDKSDFSHDSIYSLSLQIEESGDVKATGVNISSGMAKTFFLLAEIALAPSGTVVLIDEIENSLGVNCLPQLIEHFLRRSDLQLIITSHHPYIINNIPMKYWKLVTRNGSEVTVKDANSIRGLDKNSLLSGFVQLTNLEEYEEAIQ